MIRADRTVKDLSAIRKIHPSSLRRDVVDHKAALKPATLIVLHSPAEEPGRTVADDASSQYAASIKEDTSSRPVQPHAAADERMPILDGKPCHRGAIDKIEATHCVGTIAFEVAQVIVMADNTSHLRAVHANQR